MIGAVSAAREGMSVALLEPGKHLGGMESGALSSTDFDDKSAIGGYCRKLFCRVGAHSELSRHGEGVA